MSFDPVTDISWEQVHHSYHPLWTPPAPNSQVGTWHDLSGNARHLTQPSSWARPVYVPMSNAIGKPAIRFQGTNNLYGPNVTYNQPVSVVFVGAANAQWSAQSAVHLNSVDTVQRPAINIAPNSTTAYSRWELKAGASSFAADLVTGYTQVMIVVYDGVWSQVETIIGNAFGALPNVSGQGLRVGTNVDVFNGDVVFVGVYNGHIWLDPSYDDLFEWLVNEYGQYVDYDEASYNDQTSFSDVVGWPFDPSAWQEEDDHEAADTVKVVERVSLYRHGDMAVCPPVRIIPKPTLWRAWSCGEPLVEIYIPSNFRDENQDIGQPWYRQSVQLEVTFTDPDDDVVLLNHMHWPNNDINKMTPTKIVFDVDGPSGHHQWPVTIMSPTKVLLELDLIRNGLPVLAPGRHYGRFTVIWMDRVVSIPTLPITLHVEETFAK